jgi:hypothetical protein
MNRAAKGLWSTVDARGNDDEPTDRGQKREFGFGLDVSVELETDANDLMRRGKVGTAGKPAPNDRSVFIFLAHNYG